MLSDELNELQKLCKSEQAFEKLKEIVAPIAEERDYKERCLSALESAISSDYDSILITEIDLDEPGPEIVYVNDGFCEMTGYSKEEVVGKTPRILQGAETDQQVLDELKDRLKSGRCFFGQTVNYKKDGTKFINQWDIHPLFDDEGEPEYWVSYQHDITKRKQAERAFVDTQMEFGDLREQAYCTFVDMDNNGNILAANHAFCKMLGYGDEMLNGHKIWELAVGQDQQEIKELFRNLDDEDEIKQSEFEGLLEHKSGIPVQVKGELELHQLRDKRVIRAEVQNISLQKKAMEALDKEE